MVETPRFRLVTPCGLSFQRNSRVHTWSQPRTTSTAFRYFITSYSSKWYETATYASRFSLVRWHSKVVIHAGKPSRPCGAYVDHVFHFFAQPRVGSGVGAGCSCQHSWPMTEGWWVGGRCLFLVFLFSALQNQFPLRQVQTCTKKSFSHLRLLHFDFVKPDMLVFLFDIEVQAWGNYSDSFPSRPNIYHSFSSHSCWAGPTVVLVSTAAPLVNICSCISKLFVRFEFLTAASEKVAAFWGLLRSVIEVYRRSRGVFCFHRQGDLALWTWAKCGINSALFARKSG
jgi:hypothetical protein